MFFRKAKILLLALCFICLRLPAQPGLGYGYYLKGGAHFGFIVQHSHSMSHLIQRHVYGLEFDFVKPTYGQHLWEYENNFPERGYGIHFFDLGNPRQLGQLYAISRFIDIPLNKKEKLSRLHLRIGTGLSYFNKYFDPLTNHKNTVISVPFNPFVNLKWYWQFNCNNNSRLELGFSFAHSSNGKYKAPNLGINILSLNAHYTFKLPQKTSPAILPKIDSSAKAPSRHELYTIGCFGVHEIEPPGGSKYFAQTYTLGYYYNKRNTHKFGGGIDLNFDNALKAELYKRDSTYTRNTSYLQYSLKLSYCYVIGRTALPIEMGYYLHTPYKLNGMISHRIGIRYYTSQNIILNFSLKTHWAVANFFEFGAGYRLPLKKQKTISR